VRNPQVPNSSSFARSQRTGRPARGSSPVARVGAQLVHPRDGVRDVTLRAGHGDLTWPCSRSSLAVMCRLRDLRPRCAPAPAEQGDALSIGWAARLGAGGGGPLGDGLVPLPLGMTSSTSSTRRPVARDASGLVANTSARSFRTLRLSVTGSGPRCRAVTTSSGTRASETAEELSVDEQDPFGRPAPARTPPPAAVPFTAADRSARSSPWRPSIPLRVFMVNLQKFTFQGCGLATSMRMFAPAQKLRSFALVTTTARTSGARAHAWVASYARCPHRGRRSSS